jgi:hypothetical protein
MDTDCYGMRDIWEKAHGLDPFNADDHNGDHHPRSSKGSGAREVFKEAEWTAVRLTAEPCIWCARTGGQTRVLA